jgi:hypothetical protein
MIFEKMKPHIGPTKIFLTAFVTGLLAVLNLLLIFYILFSDSFFKMF